MGVVPDNWISMEVFNHAWKLRGTRNHVVRAIGKTGLCRLDELWLFSLRPHSSMKFVRVVLGTTEYKLYFIVNKHTGQ